MTDYEGEGLANKFIQYKNQFIDITLGNFYDEFGNGLILRTYYDPNLGIDNSINGFRLKTVPSKGIYLTAIIGRQRSFWELSNTTIKVLNTDILLNDILLKNWSTTVNLGASFVTKKEEDDNLLNEMLEEEDSSSSEASKNEEKSASSQAEKEKKPAK